MIDIQNQTIIFNKLSLLSNKSQPVFGKMTAHHMIEHLTEAIKYSIEKPAQKLHYPEEKANMIKALVVHSEKDMPVGFKAPTLGEDAPPLKTKSMEEAIKELKLELSNFNSFFEENKSTNTMNPVMGLLDNKEWNIFHNKHFTHHFKQFNLL